MSLGQFYKIGHISRAHGNDGKVYIQLDVDNPAEYQNLESVFFEMENKPVPFFIEFIKWSSSAYLVKFEEINNRDEAQSYTGTSLLLPLSSLPKLKENSFFYHELIDCKLMDQDMNEIGLIKLIYDQTSQILLGIERNGKEVLIPLVDEFSPEFSKENKTLKMTLPEGLIDLQDNQ
jgi:16S rRNA processing protein RimM